MKDATVRGSRKRTLIAEMDQSELAVRLMEAAIERRRPSGMSPAEVLRLSSADDETAKQVSVAVRQALVALDYFRECLNAASPVQ